MLKVSRKTEEHVYRLYVSTNNGESFEERSIVKYETTRRHGYCSLLFDTEGVLHARSENHSGFVFYTSEDGYNWDEGTYFSNVHGSCHYSNNLNLKDEKGNFLLVQYSQVYEAARVNVMHVKLRIER